MVFMDKLTKALDGNVAIGIFLDFWKAIDTVDHDDTLFFKFPQLCYPK